MTLRTLLLLAFGQVGCVMYTPPQVTAPEPLPAAPVRASLLLIASATAGAMGQAKPVEKWECKDFSADGWKTVLVTATVDSDRASGTITVAGVTWYTDFQVQGFNRRWDFGPKDHPTRYAFVIEPDGTGLYYDFATETHLTKASIVMECRQRDV